MPSLWCIFVIAATFYLVAYYTAVPKTFPRNIPVVSLWLQSYDMLRGLSRVGNYNLRIRPLLEKHGAVIIWRHGQWTVLTTKPEYVVQVFKNTDGSLSKAGSYHRSPGSMNSRLFGENIFNAAKELHSEFARILRPGMLRQVQIDGIKAHTSALARQLLGEQESEHSGVSIRTSVWNWSVSLYGEYFLDTQMTSLEMACSSVQQVLKTLNHSIFGRLEFTFPIVRHLPVRPRIVQQTRSLLDKLERDLMGEVEQRRRRPPSEGEEDKIIHLLGNARDEGQISDFHYRSNHKQLYIAGHENTEAALVSALLQLAKNQDLQNELRTLVTRDIPADYTVQALDQIPLLLGIIYETLRLYPPLWTLTNRKCLEPLVLEPGVVLPPGTLIGWHAYGIHTDPNVWGKSAREFDPLRWGTDSATINRNMRAKQAQGAYIPFGLHSRRCLGSNFALTAIKVTLCELLRQVEWSLPPDYRLSFGNTPVLRPDDCTLVVRARADG